MESSNNKRVMAKKYYTEDNEPLPAIIYAETQPTGFSLIADAEKVLFLTKKRYEGYEKDGKDFYNGFRSNLYLEIVAGNVAASDAFIVEGYLKDVKDNLITGNWMTARHLCNSLATQGIFTQTLKDTILAGMDAYITENY